MQVRKLCLIGTPDVKREVMTFLRDPRENQFHTTIGIDFILRTIEGVKFQIWDTAGQPRFATITSNYLNNAHIILCCTANLQDYLASIQYIDSSQSKAAIIIISNDLEVQRSAQENDQLCLNIPTVNTTEEFLFMVFSALNLPPAPRWKNSELYQYYEAIKKNAKEFPTPLLQLMMEYAAPPVRGLKDIFKEVDGEDALQAKSNQAASSENPVHHLRLYCSLLKENNMPAQSYLEIAQLLITDPANKEIDVSTEQTIMNLLKSIKDESQRTQAMTVIEDAFLKRKALLGLQQNQIWAQSSSLPPASNLEEKPEFVPNIR